VILVFKMPDPIRPSSINYNSIIKGTAVTLIISAAGSALLGMAFYFTGLSESTLPWFAYAMLFAGVLCGGAIAAKSAGNKGLCHGLGVGLTYFVLIMLIAFIFLPSQATLITVLAKLLITLSGGAIGGILGVGLSD
jgi:putative membrane protein (TIGR04086 family)